MFDYTHINKDAMRGYLDCVITLAYRLIMRMQQNELQLDMNFHLNTMLDE